MVAYFVPIGLMGGTPAATITLTDSQTANSSRSYTGVNFGPENSTRLIIVCASQSWTQASHGGGTSGVTIGGVSGSRIAIVTAGPFLDSFIYAAKVPTGTSGSVSFSGSFSNFYALAFSVYAANFLLSTTPADTASFNPTTEGNASVSIDVPANGIMVAVNGTSDNASFGTPNFSGATRDFQTKWTESVTSPSRFNAHETGSLTTTIALTNHGVASSGVGSSTNCLAAASFR